VNHNSCENRKNAGIEETAKTVEAARLH